MKLEIEINPDDIKSAIERNVRSAIADRCNSYMGDGYIRDQVKKAWSEAVDVLVKEMIGDTESIRIKVEKAIENKLRGQIQALMKAPKKEATK